MQILCFAIRRQRGNCFGRYLSVHRFCEVIQYSAMKLALHETAVHSMICDATTNKILKRHDVERKTSQAVLRLLFFSPDLGFLCFIWGFY